MKLKIVNTGKSIEIKSEDTSIAVVVVNGEFVFHQSLQGRDTKAAMKVQASIKNFVGNKLDKKMSYQKRFAKVASLINSLGDVTSFRTLGNRLTNVI